MDYMIYQHDQFSLLDMIEVESAQFENWYMGNREVDMDTKHSAVGGEKPNLSKTVNSSLLDDLVRLESLHGTGLSSNVHNMETDWLEREECMNWEPHLLVNPRTGAPINVGDSDSLTDGALTVTDNSFTVVPLSESNVTRQSDRVVDDIKPHSQPVQTFTAFTLTEPQITNSSSMTLQPQLLPTQANTVQVYLQVTNAVGNIIPSDGTLCLIKMENEEDAPVHGAQTVNASSGVIHSGEENDEGAEGTETYEKPVFSYSCLIAMALKNSDTGSLPVNEIYAYILEKFPYFRTAPDGWKNSIRHNLSLNKCFEKIENPTVNGSSRKGCLWGLNPAKADKMDEEIAKWIKRAAKSSAGGMDGSLIVSSSTMNVTSESHGTMQPSTPTLLTVCSQSQNMLPASTVTVVSSSGELNMLEDSLSADPMLAGATAQLETQAHVLKNYESSCYSESESDFMNGLYHSEMMDMRKNSSFWDDETDELMSTAISFGTRRIVAKGTRNSVSDKDSRQSSSITCRTHHIKTSSSLSTDRSNVLTAPVAIIANQAAIG